MRTRTRVIIGFAVFLSAVVAMAVWYQSAYKMEIAKSYEVNSISSSPHILIATQKSTYKDQLVDQLIGKIKLADRHIRVLDVTDLEGVEVDEWDAIIVIHTWEYWEPEQNAARFLAELKRLDRVIVHATSGEGSQLIEGINGITGASIIEDVPDIAQNIAERVENILKE